MPIITFPEWLPDQPPLAEGSSIVKNCVPLTNGSYGPMPTTGRYSTTGLTARCQGSYSLFDPSGGASIFAGDANRLYRIGQGSSVFGEVSKAATTFTASISGTVMTVSAVSSGTLAVGQVINGAGLSPQTTIISFGTGAGGTGTYNILPSQTVGSETMTGSAGPYSVPSVSSGGFWSMTSFGSRVIAANGADNVQTFLNGTDHVFSDLAGSPPVGKYVQVIKDFLFIANLSSQPYRTRWSAIGDPTNWPTAGTAAAAQVQSDQQDLQETDLGRITGVVGGLTSSHGAHFCERGIWRTNYVGSPAIFSFDVAQGASGTVAPLSIVQHPLRVGASVITVASYLGNTGFRAFDGVNSLPIGADKWDRFFYTDLDTNYIQYVSGVADPQHTLIAWAYMGAGSAGSYNRLLVYNWSLNRATYCDLTASPFDWATKAIYNTAYTLEQLDAFGTIDTLPASLDDPIWNGNGAMAFSVIGGNHFLRTATGPAMSPIIETSEMQPTPGRRSRIINSRALTDGSGATISVGHRERLTDPVVYEGAVPVNVIGECPQRCTGRYVRFQIVLPAATTFTHIQGVDVDVRPDSARR